ncbi:Down syndrome cell adhesion molecule Dscam2, partial [Paramuricea clavata]
MDLMTIKSQRTKLVCGLLIFAWIAESPAQGVAPKVTLSPERKQKVEYQKTATFNCTFSGNPTPDISWSFKNSSLSSSSRHNISTTGNVSILILKNLNRDDSGNYECRANNSQGNHSNTSELIVLSPPDAPTNLSLLNRTANSIDIRWNEGSFDGNSPVQNFNATIFRDGNPNGCIASPSNYNTSSIVSNPQASFSGLNPYTTYKFTVCSINSIGETCTDGSFSLITLEDVPGVPINVSLIPILSTQLEVSWEIPCDQNGIILSYYITWRIVRNDTNHIVDGKLETAKEEVDTKSFIISNL